MFLLSAAGFYYDRARRKMSQLSYLHNKDITKLMNNSSERYLTETWIVSNSFMFPSLSLLLDFLLHISVSIVSIAKMAASGTYGFLTFSLRSFASKPVMHQTNKWYGEHKYETYMPV
jgi:hypothetical protein